MTLFHPLTPRVTTSQPPSDSITSSESMVSTQRGLTQAFRDGCWFVMITGSPAAHDLTFSSIVHRQHTTAKRMIVPGREHGGMQDSRQPADAESARNKQRRQYSQPSQAGRANQAAHRFIFVRWNSWKCYWSSLMIHKFMSLSLFLSCFPLWHM